VATAAAPGTLSYAYKRAAPTPPAKSIVDKLVEKFGPRQTNLQHNALEAQLAGVRKHERAVLVVEMSVEMQARSRAREQAGERGLAQASELVSRRMAAPVISANRRNA